MANTTDEKGRPMTYWGGKCGEQRGQFYDRKGNFFREGVDPRNHVGRFVLGDRSVLLDTFFAYYDKGQHG